MLSVLSVGLHEKYKNEVDIAYLSATC